MVADRHLAVPVAGRTPVFFEAGTAQEFLQPGKLLPQVGNNGVLLLAGGAPAVAQPPAKELFGGQDPLGQTVRLGGALREALRFHLLSPENRASAPAGSEPSMPSSNSLLDRPRQLAALCAVAATGLGFAYMAAAGAPSRYLVMNGAALTLGLFVVLAMGRTPRLGRIGRGAAGLALAAALLLVSLLGVSADGVTRWISIGEVSLQPGLFLLPLLTLAFGVVWLEVVF